MGKSTAKWEKVHVPEKTLPAHNRGIQLIHGPYYGRCVRAESLRRLRLCKPCYEPVSTKQQCPARVWNPEAVSVSNTLAHGSQTGWGERYSARQCVTRHGAALRAEEPLYC